MQVTSYCALWYDIGEATATTCPGVSCFGITQDRLSLVICSFFQGNHVQHALELHSLVNR
jgi:hypothetical protein